MLNVTKEKHNTQQGDEQHIYLPKYIWLKCQNTITRNSYIV